jgi:type III pantothenate kinase
MKLLIDIGNTRLKWAYEENGRLLLPGSRIHRGVAHTEIPEFVAELKQIPDSAVALNVAGSAIENVLRAAILDRFGIGLQMVRTSVRCGEVINGYSAFEQLGADRWAAIVGAWRVCRRPVCVIDAGTAVTIDLVAGSGQHQGGLIVPGLALLRSSLVRDTSDIDAFVNQSSGLPAMDGWLGTDTRSAVERGTLLMLCATIDRAVGNMADKGNPPHVILTGGDAPLLGPLLGYPVEQHPLLVLEGLRYLSAECVDA